MGWNRIVPTRDSKWLTQEFFYFANSYCLGQIPTGWAGATAEHGETFVAAIERGPVLACQFHPELSGAAGLRLLERWKRGVHGD
jgi:imidazoleglycerol phosphate synthase glutamine amidotransferase subunit HisH